MPEPLERVNWGPQRERSLAAAGGAWSLDPFADAPVTAERVRPTNTAGALSLSAFLRFKGTLILTAAAVASLSVAAIWLLLVPEYRAKATVEILPSHPRVLYRSEDSAIPYHQQYFNSQPSLMRGVAVLQKVLARPEVQQTTWYQEVHRAPLGRSLSRLEALRDAVSAEPRPGTYLIDVSMRAPQRHDAEVIVNGIVAEYLEFARAQRAAADDAVYQRLVESQQELENEIERRKTMTSDLQRELGAASSADVVPRGKAWLEDRQAKLDELRREIATGQWQEQELLKLVRPAAAPGATAASQPADELRPRYEDDPEWRRLHIELRTAEHEIQSNPRQLGPAHPDMAALIQKAELTRALLQEEETRLDEQWQRYGGKPPVLTAGTVSTPESELAALRRRIGMLRKQEELLVADIQQREQNYARTFDDAKRLDKELDALRYESEKYDLVRRRIDEKETEGGMFIATHLVAPAFAPSEPDQDRRKLLTVAALLAALGAGLGAAYVRISTSHAIHEAAELAPAMQTPFLGQLLLLRRPERPDASEVALQGECIRMVRTALLERLNGSVARTVLITSAGPAAGKTTVTCLLAKSLAQLDRRVLLVEADWRNPAASRLLGLHAERGLIDVLRGADTSARTGGSRATADDEAILASNTPGLSVLPAGQAQSVSDVELLANGEFARCLERWRARFDVVLVDGPPVLPIADARILARQVGGTLMVVREGHCQRADVVDALAALSVSGARMLGTVYIGSMRSSTYRSGYYDYALPGDNNTYALDVRGV